VKSDKLSNEAMMLNLKFQTAVYFFIYANLFLFFYFFFRKNIFFLMAFIRKDRRETIGRERMDNRSGT